MMMQMDSMMLLLLAMSRVDAIRLLLLTVQESTAEG